MRRHFESEDGVAEVLRELGKELRTARYGAGLSQDQLAGASGIDQGTISRVERGLAPGLRFASYARLIEVAGEPARRAAERARILEEVWAANRPPWERVPPPDGPLTMAQWYGPMATTEPDGDTAGVDLP